MNNQNAYYGESVAKEEGKKKKKNRMDSSQKRLIVF